MLQVRLAEVDLRQTGMARVCTGIPRVTFGCAPVPQSSRERHYEVGEELRYDRLQWSSNNQDLVQMSPTKICGGCRRIVGTRNKNTTHFSVGIGVGNIIILNIEHAIALGRHVTFKISSFPASGHTVGKHPHWTTDDTPCGGSHLRMLLSWSTWLHFVHSV